MIVAISLTLVVFAITLPFVRAQTRALGDSAGRLDAEQVARYAQREIDRELRLATSDEGQPLIVYAGTMGIAFTTNLLAADSTDPNALEVESGAATTKTESWRLTNAATLPLSARAFPPADYLGPDGGISRNETVMYFLHPDTISDRSDVYVLYRRVNNRDSALVVSGVQVPADSAFFTYQRMVSGVLTPIAAGTLPLYWDSTSAALVRAVTLRSAGFFRNHQTGEDVIRTIYWTTRITNAGTAATVNCGAAPAAPTLTPNPSSQTSGGYHVRVVWNKSTDDGSSGDVTHYVIFNRLNASSTWIPVGAMAARGSASYRFEHFAPTLVGSVKYGVTAVDCGGSVSSTSTHSSALNIP